MHLLFQSEFDPDQVNTGLKYATGTLPPLVPTVHDDAPSIPMSLAAYPNPFNPETTIEFSVPAAALVKLDVFNLKGQLLETLVDAKLEAAVHRVVWNADAHPSGVYLLRLKTGEEVQTRRVSLVK